MKKLLVFCFPLLFGVSRATAMGENDLSNFWLFHVTNSFPQNGQITAAERKKVEEPSNEAPNFHYFTEQEVMPGNTTCHFTLNHIVNSHESGNWDDCPYVVAVPLSDAVDQIWGGHAEDLFIISPFIFTVNTIVFVPEGDDCLSNATSNGSHDIKMYKPGYRYKVVDTLIDERFKIVPCTSRLGYSDVLIGGEIFDQQSFFKILRRGNGPVEFGSHSQTKIGMLRLVIDEFWDSCQCRIGPEEISSQFNKESILSFLEFISFVKDNLKASMTKKEIEKFEVFEAFWEKWFKIFNFEVEVQNYNKTVFFPKQNFDIVVKSIFTHNDLPSPDELLLIPEPDNHNLISFGPLSRIASYVVRMYDDEVFPILIKILYPGNELAINILNFRRLLFHFLEIEFMKRELFYIKNKQEIFENLFGRLILIKQSNQWPIVKEFIKKQFSDFFDDELVSNTEISANVYKVFHEIFDSQADFVAESFYLMLNEIQDQVLPTYQVLEVYNAYQENRLPIIFNAD